MCNGNCKTTGKPCNCSKNESAAKELVLDKTGTKLLIVVGMQNDFVTGSLGTKEAQAIVPKVIEKINEHQGIVLFTKDTHTDNYFESTEEKHLPVTHCVEHTWGWRLLDEVIDTGKVFFSRIIEKPTFGALDLIKKIETIINRYGENITEIEICGVCSAIDVLSNVVILKTAFPGIEISVIPSAWACVTPETHAAAIEVMKL